MLERRLTLIQAISLNMSMMIGVGPFVTIPLLFGQLAGPPALLAWVFGAVVAVSDGLVWSELAAAFPGSGGTYHFFDAIYADAWLGRALKFLFVWQFLFSAPLEVASGMLGFAEYAGYLWPGLKGLAWSLDVPGSLIRWEVRWSNLLAMGAMAGMVALAYRRISVAGRLMVALWIGMLASVFWVIVEGLSRFDPGVAFDAPAEAWTVDLRFLHGLGGAMGLAMYSYLGYYQICYLGDEVANPSRTIPRSIVVSVLAVAAIYFAMTLGIVGVIPWQAAMKSTHVACDLIAGLRGPLAARVMASLVMWAAVAGCFAALLGYSRIPYAAAKSGHFFAALAKLHPTGDFPHRSLLAIGGLATVACLFDLSTVIEALLSSRILIQFVAQILTVIYLRSRPDLLARMPFRMVLFPIPAVVALVGWLWVFGAGSPRAIAYGALSLTAGVGVFLMWDKLSRKEAGRGND
jgi:amino acid transporter